MENFDKPQFKPQKELKGPVRRGINWIKKEWPRLNKKLVAVKRHIQRTQAGSSSRRVTSVEVLDYLLDLYIKLNPGVVIVDNEDYDDDE